MAIKQTIWSLDDQKALPNANLLSEKELEDLIEKKITLLSDDWLVIGRQVRTQYGGYIDLLCMDAGGNPIIVELKRAMTPREVTAQALDYASWVKSIGAADLAQIYLKYSGNAKSLNDAYKERFGKELDEDNDDTDVQMVIVATAMDGSTERIIKYLQEYGININVLFFHVFEHMGQRLLSRAWMFESDGGDLPSLPPPPWNGEYYFSFGPTPNRSWEDAMKYGFVSAGGGQWYTGTMQLLIPGSRIWVNIPHKGYVGVGIVEEEAKPARDVHILADGAEKPFFDLPLEGVYHKNDPESKEEHIVKVRWCKVVPQSQSVSEYGFFGNQNTACRPRVAKWDFTVERLKELWDIEE